MNLPNFLTASRIAMVPLLFATAWRGAPGWFAAFFFWALLSDVLDGPVARLLKQQSPLGGLLDSIADAALFLTAPFAAAILYPWLREQEAVTLAVVIGGYALPVAYGYSKYRRLTSYHTYGAKAAAWALSVSFFAMIVFETTLPLRLSAGVLVLAALEEMAITTTLATWRASIPTVVHAWRLRASERIATSQRSFTQGAL